MANKRDPLCFDGKATRAQVLGITTRNKVQLAYLREIRDSARRNGVTEPWLSTLALTIAKNRVLLAARTLKSRIRAELRNPAKPKPIILDERRALPVGEE
jgi:hypothetical protein